MATSLRIEDDLRNRVEHLASLRDRSPDWIMREAIRQYVEREEARESFRQEALASWESFEKTRLHLTGKEVQDWLKSWGIEGEAARPDCHE
jgi:predicted transcriptional regulator